MNDTAQIIIAMATLITACGTLILGLVNRTTIKTVEQQTNGMILSMKNSARAEGLAQGRAEHDTSIKPNAE